MVGPNTNVTFRSDSALEELRPTAMAREQIPARMCDFAGTVASLAVDPAGFLQWLKQTDERERSCSTSGTTISIRLLEMAPLILKTIEDLGQPRNPQTTEVLKGLYTTELLRFACARPLSIPGDRYVDDFSKIRPCIALCFMFNPKETLRELGFLGTQLMPSGRLKVLSSKAAQGIIEACRLEPSLWSHLELSQHASVLRGPTHLSNLFKDIEFDQLCHFPADVARYALQHYPPKVADQFYIFSELLDLPGLPTVLKYLKDKRDPEAFAPVAENIKCKVRSMCQNSDRLARWLSKRTQNGPMRTYSAAHSILRELYCICAQADEQTKAGVEFDAFVASAHAERLELINQASNTCDTWLQKGSFLRPQECKDLLSDLRSYTNEQLKTVIANGSSLEKGEPPSFTIWSTASSLLSLYATYPGAPPPFDHYIHRLILNTPEGESYKTVLRVALTHHPKETHRVILGYPRVLRGEVPLTSDLDGPSINRGLLLKLKLVLPVCQVSPEIEHLVDKRLQLGSAEYDEYLLQAAERDNEMSAFRAHEEVLTILSIVNVSEYGLQIWRDNFLKLYAKECPFSLDEWRNHGTEAIRRMLFGEHRLVPLDEGERAVGSAPHVCLPNISVHERENLDQPEQELYGHVSKLLRCTLSEWQRPSWLFKKVSTDQLQSDHTAVSISSLRTQATEALAGKPDSELAPVVIEICDAFERAAASRKTYARLAHALAAEKLITFQKSSASSDECSRATLALYGVEAKPTFEHVYFPAISLVQKASASVTLWKQQARERVEVIPTPQEELDSLLLSCQKLVKLDSQFQGPINFPRLMTVPRERNSFLWRAGQRVTLTLALVGGAGAITKLTSELYSSRVAVALPLSENLPIGMPQSQSDLLPSGSIPKVRVQLAHLSKRLSSSWLDQFLVFSLVGTTRSSAEQPALRGVELEAVRSITERMTRLPRGNSATLYLAGRGQQRFVPLPVGATVQNEAHSESGISSWFSATLDPQSGRGFTVSIPSTLELDKSATPDHCRTLLGAECANLWTPRLDLSDVEAASPTLARAILEARDMPAVEGAEHLRQTVSRLIKYTASPQYDGFRGDFAEYFREILRSGQGVCGQFAVVYDESLKHAGIPSCLVLALTPDPESPTHYFSDGVHVTNMIFVPDRSGMLVAKLTDATAAPEEELPKKKDLQDQLGELALPVGIGLTGTALGLWLAAANRRRRLHQESEALTLAHQGEVSEEPERSESDSKLSILSRSPHEDTMHSHASQVSREIASQWINHRLGSLPFARDLTGEPDFEGFDSAVSQLLDNLSTVTDSTQRILSTLQVASPDAGLLEMVQVVNAWLEAIQDPSYRKNWIASIHAHKNLDSNSKAQLLALLNDTGSEPETTFKRAIKRLLPRDSQAPIKLELFLMTAVPIDS